jgi:pimeloyl-ACP methyl ester carboxylesterase
VRPSGARTHAPCPGEELARGRSSRRWNLAPGTWSLLVVALLAASTATRAADDAPKGEDVRFRTADGLTIAATYWSPAAAAEPAPVVVALPMYRHTRATYAPVVRPLLDRGVAVLALDLRGHGDSAQQGDDDLAKKVDARDPALFNAMHADVEGAIAWLGAEKKTPKGRIALLGASVGCSVAIDVAVRRPDDVAAVACLTPGANYLGVPTMEHVAKWPAGRPLLLVTSQGEAMTGASPILAKLEGRGAELKLVSAAEPDQVDDPTALHGTKMFGRVGGVESDLADWLAFHVAFRRVDLGAGRVAIVGSTGDALYLGVEFPEGAAPPDAVALRIGRGGATDPWSKSETIDLAKRLAPVATAPRRRSTRLSRERLGVDAGAPFAVAVSLDGKSFHPEAGAPPLLFTLR